MPRTPTTTRTLAATVAAPATAQYAKNSLTVWPQQKQTTPNPHKDYIAYTPPSITPAQPKVQNPRLNNSKLNAETKKKKPEKKTKSK